MPHRPLGGITTFGPLRYEGSQTFCSLQNECYFFMMLEETWEKIFFCAFTHCASHFQNLLCTCLKSMKRKSSYSASYRNKDSFITSLFVNALTGTKGWEEKQRGSGEGMGGEWKREEERKREEKRREEKTASVPWELYRMKSLENWLRHDVGTLCPIANLDC